MNGVFSLSRFRSPGNCTLAVSTLGYALYIRSLVPVDGGSDPIGYWDVLLETLVNVQFVVAIVIPLWTLGQVSVGGYSLFAPLALRYGSFHRMYWGRMTQSVVTAGTALVTILAVTGLASIGLPLQSTAGPGSVARFFVNHAGLSPVGGFALEIMLLLVSLTAMAAIFTCLWLARVPRAFGIVFGALVWLWCAASSLEIVPIDSPWNATRLLDARFAVLTPTTTIKVGVAIVIVIVVCCWFAHRLDLRAAGREFQWPSASACLMASSPIVVVLAFTQSNADAMPFMDAFRAVFWGTRGTFLQYLTMLALWFGFIFGWQLRAAEAVGDTVFQELLRCGTRIRWAQRQVITACAVSLGYVVVLVAASAAGYAIAGGHDFSFPGDGSAAEILRFAAVGFLLIAASLLFAAAVDHVGSTSIGGLGALALLAILSMVSLSVGGWDVGNPWSLSSVPYGPGPLAVSVVILVALAVASSIQLARRSSPSRAQFGKGAS